MSIAASAELPSGAEQTEAAHHGTRVTLLTPLKGKVESQKVTPVWTCSCDGFATLQRLFELLWVAEKNDGLRSLRSGKHFGE
jgi:hypothetical protein